MGHNKLLAQTTYCTVWGRFSTGGWSREKEKTEVDVKETETLQNVTKPGWTKIKLHSKQCKPDREHTKDRQESEQGSNR